MGFRRAAAGGIAVALIALGAPAPAQTPGGAPQARPIDIGVSVQAVQYNWNPDVTREVLNSLAQAGATWVRVGVEWCRLEPRAKGRIEETYVQKLQAFAESADEFGLKILVQFGCTPKWAADPEARGVVRSRPPRRAQWYGRAVELLLEKVGSRISALEARNEPNHHKFWRGSVRQYVANVRAAAEAVERIAPSVPVVSGGTAGSDTDWIARFLDLSGGDLVDVVAVHPYALPRDLPPEETSFGDGIHRGVGGAVAVRNLLDQRGHGTTPIWITEMGWSVHNNDESTPDHRKGVTAAEQADYLTRTLSYVSLETQGIDKVFWFTARDRNDGDLHSNRFGLMRRDLSKRQSFHALQSWTSEGS